ncbi:MAG: hypothetical protein E6R00_12345 [Gammaproteobacteria bacterium]|nr:MAG: hypothetical protein E6R00_12345 [Gammaproteobacteria bacterium]
MIATSILDKKFQRITSTSKRFSLTNVHPVTVLVDLRKGCLTSLEKYLAQNRGIFDREIALELRKLIGGGQHRSRFRLMVIEHPDRPKSKGGSPKGRRIASIAKDHAIVTEFEKKRKIEGKNYLAKEELVKEGGASKSTIDRARRNVEHAEKGDAKRRDEQRKGEKCRSALAERRRRALEKLRAKNGQSD